MGVFAQGRLWLQGAWRLLWKLDDGGWPSWLLGVLLVSAISLVYSNSLHGPFQYDDFLDIQDNPSIRHLWPLRDVFYTPGAGFMTRPITNLTFAINFATAGFKPFHYHLTNLIIHIGASLALMGVLRRALSLSALKVRFAERTATLSLVATALWALHPLLTESVAYITQRYESLMGLFVFLTFYCLLRSGETSSVKWQLLASLSCLLALGSKEVAVSLPILVFLFDRTFMAGSFKLAWYERRVLYLGMMVAWGCFAFIQFGAAERTFAGFGQVMPWWRYAINQPPVILHYLRLAIWPHPLNFDYFWPVAKAWRPLLPGLFVIGSLIGMTIWALIRKKELAFLPVFFFMILAPTSSVMPILDLIVEHRMYLPLAAVLLFVVFSIYTITCTMRINDKLSRSFVIILIACSLSVLGSLTYLRNEDYQNSMDLWRDAAEKSPQNPRAHNNYALSLSKAGYTEAALREFKIAIDLVPNNPLFRSNYGTYLAQLGRPTEALEHLRKAIRLEPNNYKHYVNLGVALYAKGSLDNATTCFLEAAQINPRAAIPPAVLASVMLAKHQYPQALALMKTAVHLEPFQSDFQFRLGLISLIAGDYPGAQVAFQSAIQSDLNPEKMASDIGWAYHDHGMDQAAVPFLKDSLRQKPDFVRGQIRLAWIRASSPDDQLRSGSEAVAMAEHLLKSQPTRTPELLDLMAISLAEVGRFQEARDLLHEALAKSPKLNDDWVPAMEKRLALFEKKQPYRESPRGLLPP